MKLNYLFSSTFEHQGFIFSIYEVFHFSSSSSLKSSKIYLPETVLQTNDYLEMNCFFPFEPVVQRIFQLFLKWNLIRKSDFFKITLCFCQYSLSCLLYRGFKKLSTAKYSYKVVLTNTKDTEVEKHCLSLSEVNPSIHSWFIIRWTVARINMCGNTFSIKLLHR